MTHVLMNVMAMAILAISGKGNVVDLFIFLLRRSDLKCALSQATFFFSYGEPHHWRSSSQGRSASFCDPVLREDWAPAQDSAYRRAASLRNGRLELSGGHRCGQARWVPNG